MDFSQLVIIIVTAAGFGIIARLLRQPLLVGYLFAGLALAAAGIIGQSSSLESLGKIGVTLLLFLLGLEMNVKEIATLGKHATVAGFFEMALTAIAGFFASILLGFSITASLYIAIALTFSSTIIMVKLLSEKKDLASLYGKISVGSLLFQDMVAILILIFLAGVGGGGSEPIDYLIVVLKLGFLILTLWIFSKKFISKFFERIVSGSSELLFIVSIAWALGVSGFVAGPLGLSLEIGGFLAGLTLSTLPEHLQIASRSKSLRDFFLTIFFIYLGTQMVIGESITSIIIPAVVLSALVLIINPINVLIVMGFMGYKKRTSFLSALTVSQTSEFSLILMTVGASLNHVSQREVAVIVLVTAITMTVSTYMIMEAEWLYKRFHKYLGVFERKNTKQEINEELSLLTNHIILAGCDRTGRALGRYFIKNRMDFVVVDFNPSVYAEQQGKKVNVLFGDINDTDVLEAANIDKARMVITTFSKFGDNATLLEYIKINRLDVITIMTAATKDEARKLYESGATYVIVPDIVAGDFIKHLFENHKLSQKSVEKLGKSHHKRLIKY